MLRILTMSILKIGIAGHGVVGGALARWFKDHADHELKIHDPYKGFAKAKGAEVDAAFICVPVPTREDGTQDYSELHIALNSFNSKNKFIRSTVLPGTNDRLGTWAFPEFLTARTAYEDMCRMDLLTGCTDKSLFEEIFRPSFHDQRKVAWHELQGRKTIYVTNREAEIAKYAHNAFGAVKVNFFNLIYDLCQTQGADYNAVLSGVLMSGYINKIHTDVPGPDGQFGFGGTCFPKDLKAFEKYWPTETFKACLLENAVHRTKPITPDLSAFAPHRDRSMKSL